MTREEHERAVRALIDSGLAHLLEEARDMVPATVKACGTTDIAIIVFNREDGTASLYGLERTRALDRLECVVETAPKTVTRLSTRAPEGRFYVVISHKADLFCLDLTLPEDVPEVLN